MTRKGLLEPSKLGHILTDNPALQNYQTTGGEFIKYKGRSYCWVNISEKSGAVMYKICNIIFAMLRDNKPFEVITPAEHCERYPEAHPGRAKHVA